MEEEEAARDEEAYEGDDHIGVERGEDNICGPRLQGRRNGNKEDRRKPMKPEGCNWRLL